MTIPGLSAFYAGIVKRKNMLSVLMQCFSLTCIMTLLWYVVGYSLCFSSGGAMPGILGGLDKAMLAGVTKAAIWDTIPEALWALYQCTFAIITPALMVGSFVERMKFSSVMWYCVLWMFAVYFPACHMVWGPNGAMAAAGVLDFAGGIVVHISAGFSALAVVVALPHRKKIEAELDTDPHNIPFVALGTGLLWFGWFGFNGGSALAADMVAAYGAINTEISASCALFAWMIVEWLHKGKPTLVGACVGAIAGLATITPAAGFVRPWAAMIIGFLAAPFCYALVEGVKHKLVLDDALDVFAVHGMGGFLGTLLIGCFAEESVNPVMGIKASGEQFGKQLAAACFTAVYAFVVAYVMIKVIGKFMQLVPDQVALESGLDVSIHGERAYKDTSNSGGARNVANPLKIATKADSQV